MTDPTNTEANAALAQREANTEVFMEQNAWYLLDPQEAWCSPAIDFARWKAEDTEGLRSDEEHDTARRHTILQVMGCDKGLWETFGDDPDFDFISLSYLAELIIDHFDELWNGENAEPNDDLTDGEEIPFHAPNPSTNPAQQDALFQQVDDLLRSHFGLPSKPRF